MLYELLNMLKSVYALQPNYVGSKNSKSLVICIPSKVAKEYNLDTSTIFVLQIDQKINKIQSQTLSELSYIQKRENKK
jgi:hypothetical protein